MKPLVHTSEIFCFNDYYFAFGTHKPYAIPYKFVDVWRGDESYQEALCIRGWYDPFLQQFLYDPFESILPKDLIRFINRTYAKEVMKSLTWFDKLRNWWKGY